MVAYTRHLRCHGTSKVLPDSCHVWHTFRYLSTPSSVSGRWHFYSILHLWSAWGTRRQVRRACLSLICAMLECGLVERHEHSPSLHCALTHSLVNGCLYKAPALSWHCKSLALQLPRLA